MIYTTDFKINLINFFLSSLIPTHHLLTFFNHTLYYTLSCFKAPMGEHLGEQKLLGKSCSPKMFKALLGKDIPNEIVRFAMQNS